MYYLLPYRDLTYPDLSYHNLTYVTSLNLINHNITEMHSVVLRHRELPLTAYHSYRTSLLGLYIIENGLEYSYLVSIVARLPLNYLVKCIIPQPCHNNLRSAEKLIFDKHCLQFTLELYWLNAKSRLD